GKRLASNSGGAALRVWDTATRAVVVEPGGGQHVHAVAWSGDGLRLAGGADTEVLLWDAPRGKQHLTLGGPEGPTTAVAFSPDGLPSGSASSSGVPVWLWRVADGEPVLLIPDPLDGCTVEALAFHPQRRVLAVGGIDWLATGGSDGAIALWDLDQRAEVATFF